MIGKVAEFLFTRRGFVVFIGGYFLLLLGLRLTLFPGASEDDAEQLFFSQTLAWGYKVNQPPLYTWIVILAQQVFGVGMASVAAVKFSALFAIHYYVYRAAETVFRDSAYAALAGLSLLAVYYISWDAVVNYSHTVLMAAFLAATLYAVLKIDADKSGFGTYTLLGVLFGLGLLSKYNYALFLLPLLVAAYAVPGLRPKVFTPKIVLSFAIAAVIVLPHVFWVFTNSESINTTPEYLDVASGAGPAVVRIGRGWLDAAVGAVLFLAPLCLIYPMFFWRAFKPLGESDPAGRDHRRFFEIYFLAFAAIVAVGIAAFTLSGIRNHWMMALLPFPVYVLLRIRAAAPRRIVLQRFAALTAVFALAVCVALTGRALTAPSYCKKCNFFIPYEALAEGIKRAGFDRGTILTYDLPNQLGGNLRRYFPDSRIISRRYAYFTPVWIKEHGKCLLVWNESPWAHSGTRGRVAALAKRKLGLDIPSALPRRTVEAPLPRSRERTVKLGFQILANCG